LVVHEAAYGCGGRVVRGAWCIASDHACTAALSMSMEGSGRRWRGRVRLSRVAGASTATLRIPILARRGCALMVRLSARRACVLRELRHADVYRDSLARECDSGYMSPVIWI
jgi:hypothetical protein